MESEFVKCDKCGDERWHGADGCYGCRARLGIGSEQWHRDRLEIAKAAMQGLLAHPVDGIYSTPEEIAECALFQADALLKALAESEGE